MTNQETTIQKVCNLVGVNHENFKGYNINQFVKLDAYTLTNMDGIGKAKASKIMALNETLTAYKNESKNVAPPKKVTSSRDAEAILSKHLHSKEVEEFWVIYLNRANLLIKTQRISIGGVSQTLIDRKIIFKNAITCLASGIILSHNHPSGNTKPSQADIDMTKGIKKAASLLDMNVLDHIIYTDDNGYFSFADEGLIF